MAASCLSERSSLAFRIEANCVLNRLPFDHTSQVIKLYHGQQCHWDISDRKRIETAVSKLNRWVSGTQTTYGIHTQPIKSSQKL